VDILKLLQSIEELVYEVALWVVFIPKTFARVILRPRWCHSYVAAELNKDPKQRFDTYMSPILFWVITGIIPHLFVVTYLGNVKQSTVAQEVEWLQFSGFPLETRLLVIAIVAIGGPLGFSLQILKEKDLAINRESLRSTFYTQCLCFAPANFLLLPLVVVALRFNHISGKWPTSVFAFSLFAFVGWLFYAEVCIIRAELNIGWSNAVPCCFLYSIRSFLLTVFLEYLVIGIAIGLKWK
jgi:hypothetical protein